MNMNTSPLDHGVKELTQALAEPFEPTEVKYKPQTVSGNRAIAVAYVDARLIQDRLDQVLGVENWQDEYEPLPGGSVLCRLRVRLGEHWITKMDVGSPSEQPDEGDRTKAAFSDALKRAAVKFGIGRYLYRLPVAWVDYDPQKKRIITPPRLPEWAIPARSRTATKLPRSKEPAKTTSTSTGMPANGEELHRRLKDYDTELQRQGLCNLGELLAHVTQAGIKAGHSANITEWSEEAIQLAVAETRRFRDQLKRKQQPQAA